MKWFHACYFFLHFEVKVWRETGQSSVIVFQEKGLQLSLTQRPRNMSFVVLEYGNIFYTRDKIVLISVLQNSELKFFWNLFLFVYFFKMVYIKNMIAIASADKGAEFSLFEIKCWRRKVLMHWHCECPHYQFEVSL